MEERIKKEKEIRRHCEEACQADVAIYYLRVALDCRVAPLLAMTSGVGD